jgi:transcriptional regulator
VYTPDHFAIHDRGVQFDLIERYPFGTLTTTNGGRLRSSALPFLLDRQCPALDGHVARANPHWREFADTTDLLVGFVGPNAYVSPNWYKSPGMVPTWNYVAIEVRGRIELLDDRTARLGVVDRLSERHEAGMPQPWRSTKLDARQRDKLLDAIVAFRITIETIEAKAKLSQNRAAADVHGAAAALDAVDTVPNERRLAALMRSALG